MTRCWLSLFSRLVMLAVVAVALMGFASPAQAATGPIDMEASWYGPGFEGNLTASGEVFYPYDGIYTCAHKTLEFGTVLHVYYGDRYASCYVNDRGPYVAGRDLDMGASMAEALGLTYVGADVVTVYIE